MQCPASVKEGGLVAHAAFDCAPNGWEYCEYRDEPGADNWTEFHAIEEIRQRPRAYITISATTGGIWFVGTIGPEILIESLSGGTGLIRYTVKAGETRKIEVKVFGRGNYRKEGDTTGRIVVAPPGSTDVNNDAIASCTVTVQDDDNTAYVGSRYYHPYGGVWQKTPHCYDEVGCASRQ